MIDQGFQQVTAWNYSLSMHYVFPPIFAVVQICLSSRHDFTEDPRQPASVSAVFTEYVADGRVEDLLAVSLTSAFRAKGITEVSGLLISQNCWAEAIVNFFIWPSG